MFVPSSSAVAVLSARKRFLDHDPRYGPPSSANGPHRAHQSSSSSSSTAATTTTTITSGFVSSSNSAAASGPVTSVAPDNSSIKKKGRKRQCLTRDATPRPPPASHKTTVDERALVRSVLRQQAAGYDHAISETYTAQSRALPATMAAVYLRSRDVAKMSSLPMSLLQHSHAATKGLRRLKTRLLDHVSWLGSADLLKWMYGAATAVAREQFLMVSELESKRARQFVGYLAQEYLGRASCTIANVPITRQIVCNSEDAMGPWLAAAVGFLPEAGGLTVQPAGPSAAVWMGGALLRLPSRLPDPSHAQWGYCLVDPEAMASASSSAAVASVSSSADVDSALSSGTTAAQRPPPALSSSSSSSSFYQIVMDCVWSRAGLVHIVPQLVAIMKELSLSFQVVVEADIDVLPLPEWISLFQQELAKTNTHALRLISVPFRPSAQALQRCLASDHGGTLRPAVVVPPPKLGLVVVSTSRDDVSPPNEMQQTTTTSAGTVSSEQQGRQQPMSFLSSNPLLKEYMEGGMPWGRWVQAIQAWQQSTPTGSLTHNNNVGPGVVQEDDDDSAQLERALGLARQEALQRLRPGCALRTWDEAMTVFCCHLQQLGLPIKSIVPGHMLLVEQSQQQDDSAQAPPPDQEPLE